jgi:L-ascorbate metabolism protein UlaG (beta-lactamase superfamily)
MAGKVIYLYPFLSALPARQVPPVLRAERITHAVVVLGSHDQADHEAADLPGTLRLPLTIPIHYDTFSFNREDVGLFVDYRQVKYPPGDVLVCKHGEQVVFRRDRLHQITNSG